MGRPKVRETWCKLLDGTDSPCVSHKGHSGACKPAMGPNERVARNNCAGPHQYQEALARITKTNASEDKRVAPGVELGAKSKAGWAAAAAASAKREAEEKAEAKTPKGRKKKGEQMRLVADARDAVRISAVHEIPRPMSRDALLLASGQAAREHNKIKRLEKEIYDFANGKRFGPGGKEEPSRKEEIKALKESSAKLDREVEAEAHLIETPCIEIHDVNTRIVTIYVDDNGEPGEKVKERRMTPEEEAKALKSAPFEPPGDDAAEPPEGEPVPVDAEPLEEAIAEGPASEGGAAPGESEDAS